MTRELLSLWIGQYGYWGIFSCLVLGIVGLPIPDEFLLFLCGYLVFKNVLGFIPTVLVAVLGSALGLTMSYVLGRTSGAFLIRRYGHWLSIDDEKIRRTQHWFQNLGRWILVVGPFVPGVRNLMGYVAGAARLKLHVCARFAYVGALISSVSFVTFGYALGRHLPWNYSRIALVAVVFGATCSMSGLPLRIAFRIKNMAAAAIESNANRPAESSTQLACEPRK